MKQRSQNGGDKSMRKLNIKTTLRAAFTVNDTICGLYEWSKMKAQNENETHIN